MSTVNSWHPRSKLQGSERAVTWPHIWRSPPLPAHSIKSHQLSRCREGCSPLSWPSRVLSGYLGTGNNDQIGSLCHTMPIAGKRTVHVYGLDSQAARHQQILQRSENFAETLDLTKNTKIYEILVVLFILLLLLHAVPEDLCPFQHLVCLRAGTATIYSLTLEATDLGWDDYTKSAPSLEPKQQVPSHHLKGIPEFLSAWQAQWSLFWWATMISTKTMYNLPNISVSCVVA